MVRILTDGVHEVSVFDVVKVVPHVSKGVDIDIRIEGIEA